ncbi:MAG: hypothetical protein AAF740_10625, partial [Bacteroidota bacterium]
MKLFKLISIVLFFGIASFASAQDTERGKWQVGLQYGQGVSDWTSAPDGTHSYHKYDALGVVLNRELIKYLSVSSGVNLNFNRRDDDLSFGFRGTGLSGDTQFALTGTQFEVPLLIRYKSNHKRRLGIHSELGASFF